MKGIIFFSCGCCIPLNKIKQSMIGNSYKCLVHGTKTEIITVQKRCKYCGKMLVFKNISRIIKKSFCNNACAIAFKQNVALFYEENIPIRYFDCINYEKCMKTACLLNTIDLGCSSCEFYRKK